MGNVEQLETSFNSLEAITTALKDLGCEQAFVKLLAANQDNAKNQIFVGSTSAVMDFFPGKTSVRRPSTSSKKSHSEIGRNIPVSLINLSWVWPTGRPCPAPEAKLINYLQYPEVRLSGFLKGCQRSPQALRETKMASYGKRVLILGLAGERIFGIVVTDVDGSAVINALASLDAWAVSSAFGILPIPSSAATLNRAALERELREIIGKEYASCELKELEKGPVLKRSNRHVGYTLEALLGIKMNGNPGPDKHGFEVKAIGSEKVSIATTQPDSGFRSDSSFREYINRFGWPSKRHPGARVFNGTHKFGVLCPSSGATLGITHWDCEHDRPTWIEEPEIHLTHKASDVVISGWTYGHIKDHWVRKHAGAVYVEATSIRKDKGQYPSHYIFGPRIAFATGTSPTYLLRQIAQRRVVLDPGDEVTAGRVLSPRNQWRMNGNFHNPRISPFKDTQLTARLAHLYDQMEVIDITDGQEDTKWFFQQGLFVPSSS